MVIAAQHPVFGRGFDGFRNACPDSRTWHRLAGAPRMHRPDGGGAAICNIHPHNHYLQAATDAGLPGLVLFCALVIAWLRGLLRGLGRDPDPLRVGLFVGVLMELWPIASTSGFYSTEIDRLHVSHARPGPGRGARRRRRAPRRYRPRDRRRATCRLCQSA